MRRHNPAFIPRNHKVEEALSAASEQGDLNPMQRLLTVLAVLLITRRICRSSASLWATQPVIRRSAGRDPGGVNTNHLQLQLNCT
jgi:uncharacterized protein YdiU (UPF0061 family)